MPVTVDALIRQIEPLFTERIMRTRVSSRFKLPTHLGVYEWKTNPMDHLDLYENLMSLQGYSDEVMCKAFSTTLKGSTRSWFRKLSLRTIALFRDLRRLFVSNFMSCQVRQKNASHLFTIHQKKIESLKDYVKRFNQANKYIATKELVEAKRRRRGKDGHKRKEPDTRRSDYRGEVKNKRSDRDSRRTNDRCPRTLPPRPELVFPPLNTSIAQHNSPERRYGDDRPTSGDIQMIHAEVHQPITFINDDLRDLHLSHDDALVISATIANFNVQRILIDNGSSADILFISAFDKMKIGLDKLHPFHSSLVGFGGNTTPSLGLPNVRRDKGYQFYLPSENEVSHVNRDRRDHHVMIGTKLIEELQTDLVEFLKKNFNVFAWSQGEKWRVRIDFINHNKAYPKDNFPLPKLDLIVDATFKHELLSLMDTFSGYHQIKIHLPDVEKTSFIIERSRTVLLQSHAVWIEECWGDDLDEDLTKWKLFVDGSSNQHGCGAGLVFQTPLGEQMEYAIRIGFKATNNKVQGEYRAKDHRMVAYLDEVKNVSMKIKDFKIRQILREENRKADALANLASAFDFISDMNIPLEFLPNPSEVRKIEERMGERSTEHILGIPYNESRIPTSETQFSIYGIEYVIIPVEIEMPSFKTSNFDKENNEIELWLNLDLLD
ncbi:hypothetical protein Acr_10g0007210 [Actinidia rufa]|uniref:Retrotransposon gag domain-containing protein n=1 Tax=Actinidia rufa TaxID=165716 RepID=A0A7J0FA75_9ERIC|nr:hypothetical protein Acr_10g0007210 [Actinidia rufa]